MLVETSARPRVTTHRTTTTSMTAIKSMVGRIASEPSDRSNKRVRNPPPKHVLGKMNAVQSILGSIPRTKSASNSLAMTSTRSASMRSGNLRGAARSVGVEAAGT